MAIKAISFRDQDAALEIWAESQADAWGGFSGYVRQLIEQDMELGQMREIAPGLVKLVDRLVTANRG